MKFKIFSMLLVLAMLSVVPMIYMGKLDPVALLSGDFSMDGLSGMGDEVAKLKAKAPKNLTSVTTDEKVQLYKWRDENGVMQFSNTPPIDFRDAEQIELNPNHNVIQSTRVPEIDTTQTQDAQTEITSPYSPGGMKKVIEDARSIEGLLNKRADDQNKMLGNI